MGVSVSYPFLLQSPSCAAALVAQTAWTVRAPSSWTWDLEKKLLWARQCGGHPSPLNAMYKCSHIWTHPHSSQARPGQTPNSRAQALRNKRNKNHQAPEEFNQTQNLYNTFQLSRIKSKITPYTKNRENILATKTKDKDATSQMT